MRPATDAEALAHAVLHGEPVRFLMLLSMEPRASRMHAMHLQWKKPKSPSIERQLMPSMRLMKTCHLFRLCSRKSLLTWNQEASSVMHVLQTCRAKYVVFAREGRAG